MNGVLWWLVGMRRCLRAHCLLSRRFAVYPVRVSRITSGQRLWSQAGALALSLGSVLHGRFLVFLRVGCPLYHHTLSGDSDPGVTGAVRTHT